MSQHNTGQRVPTVSPQPTACPSSFFSEALGLLDSGVRPQEKQGHRTLPYFNPLYAGFKRLYVLTPRIIQLLPSLRQASLLSLINLILEYEPWRTCCGRL